MQRGDNRIKKRTITFGTKIAIAAISSYQIILSPLLHLLLGGARFCRYTPTCSEYAKHAIKEYGLKTGSIRALRRLLSCHPFARTT